jgi:uncharacterized protein (DUF433 family)
VSRARKRSTRGRVELGQYIVADPAICHGKPTFKGTRVFVADVLADVERGLSWDFIVHRWGGGKISKAAITEAVHLARNALLDERGGLASMSTKAQAVLDQFKALPRTEQWDIYEAIARTVVPEEYGPLSDEELVTAAAQSFALLDQEDDRAQPR